MRPDDLLFEDARILWPNFGGNPTLYNRDGDRMFNIWLPDKKTAEELAEKTWNVKEKTVKETGEPYWLLPVAVKFENYPPTIHKVGNLTAQDVLLNEETVELLDLLTIVHAKLHITPYDWSVNGKTGRKAYLREGWFIVDESPLTLKMQQTLREWEPGTPLFGD